MKICFLLEDTKRATKNSSGSQKPNFIEEQAKLIQSIHCLKQYDSLIIDDHSQLIPALKSGSINLLFNICDLGYMGNSKLDPHLIALCDIYNVPYLGKNLRCHHYTNDKNTVSHLAKALGISVPNEVYLQGNEIEGDNTYDFPSILKPAHAHESAFLSEYSIVNNKEELIAHYKKIRSVTTEPVILQQFIPSEEVSVGMIGNDADFLDLPLLEIDYSKLPTELPKIITESAKKRSEHCVYAQTIGYKKADLKPETVKKIYDLSKRLFKRLFFKDYARFDWRLDEHGEPFLIEVNANPGVMPWGYLSFIAGYAGMTHVDLLDAIIQTGIKRLNQDQ